MATNTYSQYLHTHERVLYSTNKGHCQYISSSSLLKCVTRLKWASPHLTLSSHSVNCVKTRSTLRHRYRVCYVCHVRVTSVLYFYFLLT